MAIEISSMVAQQRPTSANDGGQFVKLDGAKDSASGGNAVDQQGNNLPQQSAESKVSKTQLRDAVDQINTIVQNVKRDLSFSLDEGSGKTVIRVIDSDSGKLVRQIPSEEVLALASYLQGVTEDSFGSGNIPPGFLFSDST